MCQFKFTRHSCGHTLPKLEEPDDPSCKLCVPVLVALKYYHDQPTQICIENSFQQPPMRMPKPCLPIGPNRLRDAEDIAHTHAQDRRHFEGIMDQLGVDLAERRSIEQLAIRHNQTSKRTINVTVPLRPLCPSKIRFMTELETWQHRPYQPPNITFNTVTWGCGGTGPGVQSDCLVGWTGQGILMYRHGIWNVNPPRPWDAGSPPPPVGYLCINYGEAPVLQLPERWRASATRTLIDIPMYACLFAVLRGRPSGPLIHDDQGYLIPALGASGPEVLTGPHIPPPPLPISSALPRPQLPISSVHMGQLRPPQVFASHGYSRQRPGHRYPAPWKPSASITQTTGESKPNETHKQRVNRIYKERHGHNQTEAGPSQPVDRAETTTKIKELPQRRASRSGNVTPASTASAGVSQPVYSTHPTPGSTRAATPTGNVPLSDETITGLGIIHESPTAASVEAKKEHVENTIPHQTPHHRIPHHHEASTSMSASEGKKPIRPLPSRQTSTKEPSPSQHPNIKPPSPPDEVIFDMSSNMLIGAAQPSAQQPKTQSQPSPPQEVCAFQPPQTRTERPFRSNLIQNIAQSTSNMTQYAAQLTALQQAPGLTYTLNPTAEAFMPGSSDGEGDGKSEK